MQLTVARDMESLQEALAGWAREGKRVGLVPTMGALHEGHISLIKQAQALTDVVVATIFVNPKQFGPNEDFATYPRSLEADINKLDEAGVSLVYAPPLEEVYPEGFSTSVSAGPLGEILEGQFRPGFFTGVATVVTKLLLRILPHVAVFGEKDYQQLCVIRRVVDDLDIAVEIVGAPTVREKDGLAMSSRNLYLSMEERRLAPKLHEALVQVGAAITEGHAPITSITHQAIAALTKVGFKVDYLELRDADNLAAMDTFVSPARVLVAAWLGKTRLIDNIAVE